MKATLVHDNVTNEVLVPPEMGTPREDQMRGTPGARLSELAGRVCYDSLGKGRSSEEYHAHISEVGHGSVREHYNYCIEVRDGITAMLMRECLNRPGLWATPNPYGVGIRLCLNLRTAYEWRARDETLGRKLASTVQESLAATAPQIGKCPDDRPYPWYFDPPAHEEERWFSFFMQGSRGFSHEQVRHKWRTAVSQRSTRYCDESETPWVEHPLVTAYRADGHGFNYDVVSDAQACYESVVNDLQGWLLSRGVDKLTARKQARGAARGYLGNALQTEMIFSASLAQWRRMLAQRLHPAADAEIRAIYEQVLEQLPIDLETKPSPDGLGRALA